MINAIDILDILQDKSSKAFDIALESIKCDDFDTEDYYTESVMDSVSKFFENIVKTIKDIINKVREAVKKLFKQETVEKEVDDLEKTVKENPSFGNVKINVKDYKGSKKLNDEIRFEIVKAGSVYELETKMKKYRKQRNTILATSVVAAATVSAAIYFILKGKDQKLEELAQQERDARENCEKYEKRCKTLIRQKMGLKSEIDNLKDENERLKADTLAKKARYAAGKVKKEVGQTVNNAEEEITLQKEKAKATLEVVKNATTDTISSVRETFSALGDAKKGFLSKAKTVADSVGDIKETVKKVADGSARKENADKKSAGLEERISNIKKSIENAKKVLNNPDATDDKKQKAREYLKAAPGKLSELTKQLNTMKRVGK